MTTLTEYPTNNLLRSSLLSSSPQWAGVGLAKGLPEEVVKRVMNSAQACERWRTCKVLVIDEVSMLDNQLFEKLDAVGRTVRKTPHFAFGGIQLILTGDFFQLPPVGIGSWGKKFAFQSNVWGSCNMQIVLLKTVVRQEGDQAFIRLLNEFRLGNASPSSLAALALCSVAKKPFHNDGVLPTRLYCTNAKVDDENRDRLEQLPGHSISFEAGDIFRANEGGTSAEGRKKLLALIGKKTPSSLKLKVGAQVVLTVNRPSLGLVNGSRGVVVGLAQKHKIYEGDKEAFGVAAGEVRDWTRSKAIAAAIYHHESYFAICLSLIPSLSSLLLIPSLSSLLSHRHSTTYL